MCTEVSQGQPWPPGLPLGLLRACVTPAGGGGGVGCSLGAWPPLHGPEDPVHQPIRPRGPEGDRILEDGE